MAIKYQNKTFKIVLFTLVVSQLTKPLMAQNQVVGPQLVNVIHPSPTVMAMQKYGDIPVSPYTGVPNISIPLYTIKSHDITVPISLSYHASGIKVAEEASNVGLGWVLNAGGTISRNILGTDDFLNGTYFNSITPHQPVMDFTNGKGPAFSLLSYIFYPPGPHCQVQTFDETGPQTLPPPLDLTDNLTVFPFTDFQPDQYYFNISNLSGKFILKRDFTAVLQNQEKLKIECVNTDGSVWKITGLDGTVYNFNNVYEQNYNNDNPGDKHKSAWYLTNITSPTGNHVDFHYTVLPYGLTMSSTYSESTEAFEISPDPHDTQTDRFPDMHKEVYGNIYSNVILSDIEYDNGKVVFNYSDNRDDLPGDKRLESISIYKKDNQGNLSSMPIKSDSFTYDYFTAIDVNSNDRYNSSTGNPLKRLKLTGIVENGYYNGQLVPGSPYAFTYYETNTNSLPPKDSFARDHWGYFNGKTLNTTFIPTFYNNNGTSIYDYYAGYPGPEREPDPAYTQAFSLKTITYPTGGSTDFQYETNDFDEQKSIINDNSAYSRQSTIVKQTANFTYYNDTHQYYGSNSLDMTNEFKNSSGNIIPGSLDCTFRLSGGQGPINSLQPNLMYISFNDLSGNEVLHIDPGYYDTSPNTTGPYVSYDPGSSIIEVHNIPFELQPGKYTWTVYCNNTSYAQYLMDAHSIVNWYTQVSSDPGNGDNSITYSQGGGLRVLRITDHDGINSAHDKIKKFIYHYTALGSDNAMHEYSFGRRMAKPQYSFWQPTYDIFFITMSEGSYSIQYYDNLHLMRSSDSNIGLNGSAGGVVVGYDQVTLLYGENGENGKTVYNYLNDPDYVPGYVNTYGVQERPPYASDFPNTGNGSLTNQIDYVNNAGVFTKVKEVTNTYSYIQANENIVYGMERRQKVYNLFLDGSPTSSDPTVTGMGTPRPCDNLELLAYRVLGSEFKYLFSSDEKLYNQGDETKFVETLTYYFHNNPNHLLTTSTVTVNSKGEKITSAVTYPLDFTTTNNTPLSQAIQAMQLNNIVNAPIETYVVKSNSDYSNPRVISALLTAYNPANLLPTTLYQMQSTAPVTNFLPLAISSSSTAMDPSYKPVISFDSYDNHGNILLQHRINGPYKSYAWGYNNNFPIAEMTSSVPSLAYTSFEDPANNIGSNQNWSYSGWLTLDRTCPTGIYCYNLANGGISCTASISAANSYIISYWTKNASSFTIPGTIAGYPKQGSTINGWTYFEHKITGQTAVSITGAGFIDELRLYPAGAMMTTYAYDPGAGMTASLDGKSKATRYEYDGFLRLQNIKDQLGNIIKSFCYSYAGQSTNCYVAPVLFSNSLRQQTFTKTCGNGYTGSPVTYTIQPGQYTSTSSQADADNLALEDIQANGQNYANANGTCLLNINFSITNTTTTPYEINFSSGQQSYTYDFNGSVNTTITVPSGTYYLNIYPQGSNNNNVSSNITLGNRPPATNTPRANFNNVNISTGGTDLTLTISGN